MNYYKYELEIMEDGLSHKFYWKQPEVLPYLIMVKIHEFPEFKTKFKLRIS